MAGFADLSSASTAFGTLAEMLARRAAEMPERVALTFLGNDEKEEATRTYRELDAAARGISSGLAERYRPGDRALLAFPPGLEFIDAFFGCMYAGLIAVPVTVPRGRIATRRFEAIARDCSPAVTLTIPDVVESGRYGRYELRSPIVFSDQFPPDPAGLVITARLETVAMVQYSSGSTGDPKGVILTHANIVDNQPSIRAAFGHDETAVVVSWLPHIHDMGLIGSILQPLYLGARAVLLSPDHFARDPACWLRAISKYRASTSGGPNFAYDLCVDRITKADRAEFDLSSWRVAFNGAEPVRSRTMQRFAEAFDSHGFKVAAFLPCYGLAESTLLVAAGHVAVPISSGPVACGSPLGVALIVVNPETRWPVAPGEEGELWVSGGSVAVGYWNRPDDTQMTFAAERADCPGELYLRTGDIGYLREGELYVTGRLKDLIILNGRNIAPEDIEGAIQEAHPALRSKASAAFAIPVDDGEAVVIAAECDMSAADPDEVMRAIRRAALDGSGVLVRTVLLVRSHALPRTTSGKIRRGECRDLFVSCGLRVIHRLDWTSENELQEFFADLLGMVPKAVPTDQSLVTLGLDSLRAVQLAHEIERCWGVRLSSADLLSEETLAGLATRIGSGASRASAPPTGIPLPTLGGFPLSIGQQALWLLELHSPGTGVNIICRAGIIRGPVDETIFAHAWSLVRNRHPSLRMRVQARDGMPHQSFAPVGKATVKIRDAADWSEAEVGSRLAAESTRSFDLYQEDPLRIELWWRGSEERILVISAHHMAVDFWSLAAVAEEFAAVYVAESTNLAISIEPPVASYSDFVYWQQSFLDISAATALDYWNSRRPQDPTEYELPADRPGPPSNADQGAIHSFELDPELSRSLVGLAERSGTTPAAVWLTAFGAVLARYADRTEIVVGVPFAGRPGPVFDRVVGHFVNTLPIVVILSGEPSVQELVSRTGRALRTALEHQHLPYPILVERLRYVTAEGAGFQTLFTFQQAARLAAAGLAGWSVGAAGARVPLGTAVLEALPLSDPSVAVDLDLAVAWASDRFVGRFKYRVDRFDPQTVACVASHLRTFLEGMAADPDRVAGYVSVLTGAEREAQLVDWNQPDVFTSVTRCLHEQWEETVRSYPERLAVVGRDRTLTYAEADLEAEHLAVQILARGGAEPLVGVIAEHDPAFLSAAMGILKSGRGMVPIDLAFPDDWLAFQLRDSGVRLIVVGPGAGSRLSTRLSTLGVRMDVIEVGAHSSASPPHRPPADPDSLVYLLYTSGSTGRPKGVPITHRNLMPLMDWQRVEFGLGPNVKLVQTLSYTFDFGIQELFTTILYGGTVYFFDGLQRGALDEYARFAAECQVTMIYATPSLAESLLNLRATIPTARVILLGGEILTKKTAAAVLASMSPECRLYNGYGPTEASINATMYRLQPDHLNKFPAARSVPIGRISALNRVYLLDGNMEPVPAGGLGELYIGGPGVSAGYWMRPDLTAQSFLPNPFVVGDRLYRTGDRARSHSGGFFEFRGRIDRQVKIRGYRIELEQVETVIGELPTVREAVVVAYGEGADGRLVAFVTLADPATTSEDLRRRARDRLPAAMIPIRFIILPDLPRTPSGKVDRGALRDPGDPPISHVDQPGSEIEALVAAVWEEALGRSGIGRHANFFDLGGHSLLLVRVHARLEERLGKTIPVSVLFEQSTVVSLAAALSTPNPTPVLDPALTNPHRSILRKRAFGRLRSRPAPPTEGDPTNVE